MEVVWTTFTVLLTTDQDDPDGPHVPKLVVRPHKVFVQLGPNDGIGLSGLIQGDTMSDGEKHERD